MAKKKQPKIATIENQRTYSEQVILTLKDRIPWEKTKLEKYSQALEDSKEAVAIAEAGEESGNDEYTILHYAKEDLKAKKKMVEAQRAFVRKLKKDQAEEKANIKRLEGM